MEEILIQQQHEEVIRILGDMLDRLKRYEQKKDARQDWIRRQRKEIATLGEYVSSVQRTVAALQVEADEMYRAGYEKGKQQRPKDTEPVWINPLQVLRMPPHVVKAITKKENLRKWTIEKAKTTQPNLY
jgi:predicted nuclease with TOPRIM domain